MKTMLLGDICSLENNEEYFKKLDLDTLFGDTLEHFKGKMIFSRLAKEYKRFEDIKYIKKYWFARKRTFVLDCN